MIILIAGTAIILVAILAAGLMQSGQGPVVSPSACGEKAIAYINTNLVAPGTAVSLVSISDSHGLYELKCSIDSQAFTLYATKDCSLLFTNTVNMTVTGAQQSPQTTTAPVKSARPAVDLYVMSFCPYGTQAETAMSPVAGLLGSRADIRIRFVATVTGTTADSVDSLHGLPEAKEDLQQACINKYYPEKIWAYLNTFNEECYPAWQNATALETCRKNTTAALSVDSVKIDTCAQGPEGIALLKADETISNQNSVSSSPTLFINGVKYSGARTPEAYKQAICNSFETMPEECSTVLSSASSTATGGCG